METFRGEVIQESLANPDILSRFTILSTRISVVTPEHKTPWLQQWTLHTIEVPADRAEKMATDLSHALDVLHCGSWYVDFKSSSLHYVIYPGRVFQIDRRDPEQYRKATEYGISIGIPAQQVDFEPSILKAI